MNAVVMVRQCEEHQRYDPEPDTTMLWLQRAPRPNNEARDSGLEMSPSDCGRDDVELIAP